jgi:hypothetical protein
VKAERAHIEVGLRMVDEKYLAWLERQLVLVKERLRER